MFCRQCVFYVREKEFRGFCMVVPGRAVTIAYKPDEIERWINEQCMYESARQRRLVNQLDGISLECIRKIRRQLRAELSATAYAHFCATKEAEKRIGKTEEL